MIGLRTAMRGVRGTRTFGSAALLTFSLLLAACPGKEAATPQEKASAEEAPLARRVPLPEPLSGGVKVFTFDLAPYGSGELVFRSTIQGATQVEERRVRSDTGDLHVTHLEGGKILSDRWLIGDVLYERTPGGCRSLAGGEARAAAESIGDTPLGSLILASPLVLLEEGVAKDACREVEKDHYRFHVDTVDRANHVTADGTVRVDAEGRPVSSEGEIALDLVGTPGARSTASWRFEVSHVGEPVTVPLPDVCMAAVAPSADLAIVPRPDDANTLWSMPESIAFETATPVDDLVSFYEARMRKDGWSEVKTDITGKAAALRFHRREQMVIVSISADEARSRVVLTSRD